MSYASVFPSFHLPNPNQNPKSTNTPKPSRLKPTPNHSIGGEATSYTRLPPKQDFHPNPSPFSDIIKLRESFAASPSLNSFKPTIPKQPLPEDHKSQEELLPFELTDDEDEDVKQKGVPAVMRCFDRAKIYVKSGDGGNGVVAFRREKHVPYGGPSGGDGGKGGDVYVEVDGSMNSLLAFRKHVHFRGGRGGHGMGRKQVGGKGEDVVVKVAPGTVVRECGKGGMEGVLLVEMMRVGERVLVFRGGRGGRGNAAFKSGGRRAPRIAENGEAGAEMLVCVCFCVVCFLVLSVF